MERAELRRLLGREASDDLMSAQADEGADAVADVHRGEVAQLLRYHPLTDRGLRLLEKHVPQDFWLPPLLRDPTVRRALGLSQLSHLTVTVTVMDVTETASLPPPSTDAVGDRRKMSKA